MSDSLFLHPHADVLGVQISAINLSAAVAMADHWIANRTPGYVCVTGVHGVMEAQSDPLLRAILNQAFLNTPDGMPMSWIGHLQGYEQMDRVYGPDFMTAMCNVSVGKGYRHFLYGGRDGVAELLSATLRQRFPGLQVTGTYTPPFRALTSEEEVSMLDRVHQAQPDILWVGLSTPKQERFMASYLDRLRVPLLVGVGAAFDILTGRIHDAPLWVKRRGLQWLHRMIQEPRRLAPRYLINNPRFLFRITLQLALRGPSTS